MYKIKEKREGNREFTKRGRPHKLSVEQEVLYSQIAELKSIVKKRIKDSKPVSPQMAHTAWRG